jgi:hypothetical protein
MAELPVPTLADVLEARRRISPHLRSTPLFGYATLNDLLDANVFVQAREPPADGRLQGPRRSQSSLAAQPGGA